MVAKQSATATAQERRRTLLHAPPRAWALAEWSLLPLRAFLGVTFLYAGLQKLANPAFFSKSSPISIQSQLIASARVSPIGSLLTPLEHVAVPVGILIAVGEVAIGLGTLLGLWGRVAAVGGALMSFTLFLTVSFHSSPYFTGADIVFLFAWTPLIIAGSGSRWSLDGRHAHRAATENDVADPQLVVVPFSQIHDLCGHYDDGACRARQNQPCDPVGCPVLEGPRAPLLARREVDDIDRRNLVLGATSVAIVAGGAVLGVGAAAGAARALNSTKSAPTHTLTTTTTTTTPGSPTTTPSSTPTTLAGTDIGAASAVPVNSYASFTVPSNGDPGIVICPKAGEYVAYDAVCPHAGCTVGYFSNVNLIVCPCHGSEFDVQSGDVVQGPAPHGLTKFTVTEGSDGNLYLS